MTPMVDVTFLLLIFFMCTIKFKKLEGKLAAYLPKDMGLNNTQVDPVEKLDIRLDVINEGTKLAPRRDGPFQPGVHARYQDAGHIIGSAGALLEKVTIALRSGPLMLWTVPANTMSYGNV